MARIQVFVLAVFAVCTPYAQEQESANAGEKRALEWVIALGGRYQQLHNPVTAAYGVASVASLVCPIDKVAGIALFQDALNRLNLLPGGAFDQTKQVLPISSFSRLWKFVVPAAAKCDPSLSQFADGDKVRSRLDAERQKANSDLAAALEDIEATADSNPDRDAQMADAALAASGQNTFDMATFVKFMAKLRDRAPDLTDELLPAALDFITSAPAPNPSLLAEFGNYLFVSAKYFQESDADDKEDVLQAGSYSIPNLFEARQSTNSDDVKAYIEAAVKVLAASQDPNYDPVAAYALALQLLSKTADADPAQTGALTNLVETLAMEIGGSAGQVQAVAGTSAPDPSGGNSAVTRNAMTGRVLKAASAGRFAEARQILVQVDDVSTRSQVSMLIDFAEAAHAIGLKNVERAGPLANPLTGGVKRGLLYAGMISASPRQPALDWFPLAMKESDLLPAEQRIGVLSAIASATFAVDTDSALLALKQAVEAANDATVNPRRGKFDPKSAGSAIRPGKGSIGTDSALVVIGSGSAYEVVDTGHGRHSFQLLVPGARSLNIPAAAGAAKDVDPDRVAAILLELHDETRLVKALNALAAVRLKAK